MAGPVGTGSDRTLAACAFPGRYASGGDASRAGLRGGVTGAACPGLKLSTGVSGAGVRLGGIDLPSVAGSACSCGEDTSGAACPGLKLCTGVSGAGVRFGGSDLPSVAGSACSCGGDTSGAGRPGLTLCTGVSGAGVRFGGSELPSVARLGCTRGIGCLAAPDPADGWGRVSAASTG